MLRRTRNQSGLRWRTAARAPMGVVSLLVSILACQCGGNVIATESGASSCVLPGATGRAPGVEQTSPGLCSLQAADEAGNSFRALCDEQGCDCYYNGGLLCSCPARQGWASTCSNGVPTCCSGFPFGEIEPQGGAQVRENRFTDLSFFARDGGAVPGP